MKRARYLLVLMVSLMVLVLGLSGCGTQEPAAQGEEQLSGTIITAGSTSVQPFSDVLAEEFMARNPGVTVTVQGGGSSAGVKAAYEGAADIGAASRALKESEMSLGLTVYTIALDGIAIIVHPDNNVADISLADLKEVYAGRITNWSQLGGADAAINVYNREEGSGTRSAFEELVMGEEPIVDTALVQNSTGAVRAAVAGDNNGIGYISLASMDPEVKALTVEGVAASAANVKNGTYAVARPFNYLVKGEASELVQAYIDFVLGPVGQQLAVEEGLVPVN